MLIGSKCDRTHGFLPDAVFVHEALHPHRKTLRRRKYAVWHQIRLFTRDGIDAGCLSKTAVLSLIKGAENDHTVRETRNDGSRGISDGGATAPASASPLHRRGTQLVYA